MEAVLFVCAVVGGTVLFLAGMSSLVLSVEMVVRWVRNVRG